MHKNISAEILGQLSLMQSVIIGLPNIDIVMQFIQKGLQDVPGVDSVTYILDNNSQKIIHIISTSRFKFQEAKIHMRTCIFH